MEPLPSAFTDVLRKHGVENSAIAARWNELVELHGTGGRLYHTLDHLRALFAELGPVTAALQEPDAVVLAIAYHDSVYDTASKDNEERSAALMRQRLAPLGLPEALLARTTAHILATKAHTSTTDPDTDLFTDADLSILGAEPERYRTYAAQIRKEYRRYPSLLYRPGRRKVLEHFLAMPRIFKTAYFHDRYEAQARLNLAEEHRALGGKD